MKSFGLKSVILIVTAGILLVAPTVLLLGAKSKALPTSTAASLRIAPEESVDDESFMAAREGRPLAKPTASPAVAPGGTSSSAAPGAAHAAPPAATPRPAAPAPAPASVPAFTHVFVIVMENNEYGNIIGSGSAPYINSLARSYGLATNYYGASHPSLPNYLALTAGSTFGITSDCTTCYVNASNIADQVEASGRSWKAYMEDMPSPCYAGASYANYAMKHDPFMYYNDIRNNPTRCAAHVVPFTQFSGDIASGNVPNFVWITPNLCNDMHDCSVATGDGWLSRVVPMITGSAAYRNGGVLFITWDEGSSSAGCCGDSWGGHLATLVISPRSINGFRSAVAENHYGLLRTIEDAFRLSHLNAASWSSNVPLREYFR